MVYLSFGHQPFRVLFWVCSGFVLGLVWVCSGFVCMDPLPQHQRCSGRSLIQLCLHRPWAQRCCFVRLPCCAQGGGFMARSICVDKVGPAASALKQDPTGDACELVRAIHSNWENIILAISLKHNWWARSLLLLHVPIKSYWTKSCKVIRRCRYKTDCHWCYKNRGL